MLTGRSAEPPGPQCSTVPWSGCTHSSVADGPAGTASFLLAGLHGLLVRSISVARDGITFDIRPPMTAGGNTVATAS
jgi:hypothetical protein